MTESAAICGSPGRAHRSEVLRRQSDQGQRGVRADVLRRDGEENILPPEEVKSFADEINE